MRLLEQYLLAGSSVLTVQRLFGQGFELIDKLFLTANLRGLVRHNRVQLYVLLCQCVV